MPATKHGSPCVLLIGASVRWAAQSAAAGGYRVIAMDLFGDLDTRAASARCEIISAAEQADPDKLSETIARIARQENAVTVWVGGVKSAAHHSEASARQNEERLTDLARNAGFRCPETVPCSEKRRRTDARWLVKESNSTGGLGVRFYDQCRTRPNPAGAMMQRWIPGRSMGLVAIADRQRVSLLGMTQSIFHRWGDLPFVYAGSRTHAHDDAIPWSSMQSLCERIADARGLQGLFNLDWIHDRQDQWWLLEVNERPSASCEVIERAMQTRGIRPDHASLMRMHLAALLPGHASPAHTFPHAAPSQHRPSSFRGVRSLVENGRFGSSTHVKRIVYSRRTGRIELSALASLWRTRADILHETDVFSGVQIADIPADGTPVQQGQPIATLLFDSVCKEALSSATLHRAVRRLQAAVS